MPKALNRVQFHYMHFYDQKTYNCLTTVWEVYFLSIRRKIVDDVQDPMVVLSLHIRSHCFFVARLQAQERPAFAARALSDMWEVGAQN